MCNVKHGNYNPPEEKLDKKENIIFGIFFDGTLNNKNNTQARENNTAAFQKYGKSKKEDTSYYNDWSNVARLWKYYTSSKIYIEGIGTEDSKGDETMGYAFGSGTTGIRGKVRKGCERIVKELPKGNVIETLTLDVFGFSRGAAAARNFVHEIFKSKYKAKSIAIQTGNPQYGGAAYTYIMTDEDGYSTKLEELPRRGHLGLKLEEAGIEVETIIVRFLGLFDSVSSYSKNISLSPDFSNDVDELNLNDIGRANRVIHFIAENEHRNNFALTHTHVGIEKEFPGVHSDIGGGYNNGEEIVEEIETTWTYKPKLYPLRDRLIEEGWYTTEQLTIEGGIAYFNLKGTRLLSKKYSYIPLYFMAEFGINEKITYNIGGLKLEFNIVSEDQLLNRVEARLRKYVFEDDIPYHYIKNSNTQEQKDLKKLRNEYLHWSSRREGIGMDPTSDRNRLEY